MKKSDNELYRTILNHVYNSAVRRTPINELDLHQTNFFDIANCLFLNLFDVYYNCEPLSVDDLTEHKKILEEKYKNATYKIISDDIEFLIKKLGQERIDNISLLNLYLAEELFKAFRKLNYE